MKHPILPWQAIRTIHTPAIANCAACRAESRACTASPRSTVGIRAAHIRAPSPIAFSFRAARQDGGTK